MNQDTAGLISIHALCEEGDQQLDAPPDGGLRISIHALCEEGDRSADGLLLL